MVAQNTTPQKKAFRDLVWDAIFEAEYLAQYYPLYERKLKRAHGRETIFTIVITAVSAALITTTVLMPKDSAFVYLLIAIGAAGSAFASFARALWTRRSDTSQNMALAAMASTRWRYLATKWRLLWSQEDLGDSQSRSMWDQLQQEARIVHLETDCGAFDDKLAEQSAKDAEAVIKQAFQSTKDSAAVAQDA